jgi:hypothetical protein
VLRGGGEERGLVQADRAGSTDADQVIDPGPAVINSEDPDRARGPPITQRSADTPPRFIAESRMSNDMRPYRNLPARFKTPQTGVVASVTLKP